jgi:hypothetical protein
LAFLLRLIYPYSILVESTSLTHGRSKHTKSSRYRAVQTILNRSPILHLCLPLVKVWTADTNPEEREDRLHQEQLSLVVLVLADRAPYL